MNNNDTDDDGRKCWGSARERERRRARFHIRERVVDATEGCFVLLPSLTSSNLKQIQQYIHAIKVGDRSKFSLSELDRNFVVVSARIPIHVLDTPTEQKVIPAVTWRDHSFQLCTAWFGVDYSNSLENYMTRLDSFTLMEYAVWMGKFSIVGSLLMGGVNPCVRGHVKGHNEVDTDPMITARVHQRFFQCFPLPLSTYIVKRVVELRWATAVLPSTVQEECALCHRNDGDLLWFKDCGHFISERCLWNDIIEHIDSRGDYPDVVVCPYCETMPSPLNNHGRVSLNCGDAIWIHLSPLERCQRSLQLFHELPLDRVTLKKVTGKKKKLPEQDHWAANWNDAISPSLGLSQSVRHDKFWYFLERNSIYYIRGCLFAGVDVNWRNEYGQTALSVAASQGNHVVVQLLLDFGADPALRANDGMTPLQIAMALGKKNVCELLLPYDYLKDGSDIFTLSPFPVEPRTDSASLEASILIPLDMDHQGAGSYMIENVFSNDQVDWLLNLHRLIPVDDTQKKKKTILCSDRSYYCDSACFVRSTIEQAIMSSPLRSYIDEAQVFIHMRFLHYSSVGTTLNPHVDICRTDPMSGVRSTHTLIAYLTDCHTGGETSLLMTVSGEGRNEVLARVMPRRGRLLMFPHACPHEGNEVIDVPKIILRGEVFLRQK